MMDRKIIDLVKRLKSYLKRKYKDRIKDVILYGSYARGEAKEDSDVDVIVVVEKIDPTKVRKGISRFLFDLMLEQEELISVIVVSKKFFEEHSYPFLLNVKREGVKI